MTKFIALLVVIMTISIYVGNLSNFKLRNTGVVMKGANTDHQYIVDEITGDLVVKAHVIDLHVESEVAIFLRVKSNTYECGEDRVVFTHYDNSLEILVMNLTTRDIDSYSINEYHESILGNRFNTSFNFDEFYSNDKIFHRINDELGCVKISQ
ncbi:hypothetical protein [Ferrimonas balearica]|uniref:hypothetical protein n=1 Tax=Ferrimonas balearica TaxID=44012 RepID=UPI001C992949|nr:hypothetical protein [Ferrimonas balearica]MBY5921019.1 hypothetical protein [Ferrimonas balearica]MBY5996296.1 hypothetical protein [Ferrimonas balearica]